MLKRLRHKFIAIVMALVGTVLVAVLGSTYLATYQTQMQMIEDSLNRSVYGSMDDRPMMGMMRQPDGSRMGGMLGLLVEVDPEGIIVEVSDAPVIINTSVLESVIDRVVSGGEQSGLDRETHIAWTSIYTEDDEIRIALIDTSSSDTILREQAIKDLQIVVIALAVLYAITWWLSDWALRPVERAWEQQRRFVADASHELKTPLAVILANTQILERDETIGEDAMRWVRSTADEASHMKALVGDLLQLARADESAAGVSAGAMRHEDIDLSEMVEAATLEFDAIAFERGCLVEDDIAPDLHVSGDPEWIERVVRILVDNACKYAARGSTVTVRLSGSSGHPILAVHNMGSPIDAEDLPHVFERFYRTDEARSREAEGGFGLGLAIAKGIVDAHGGKISVSSTEEEGTTFTVAF